MHTGALKSVKMVKKKIKPVGSWADGLIGGINLHGAPEAVRNGKMVKPAGRFVRSLFLVDALKIGTAQNRKMINPIGRVEYIRPIVRPPRPVF